MRDSNWMSTADVIGHIDAAHKEYVGLIASLNQHHYVTTSGITWTPNSEGSALPDNCSGELLGVDVYQGGIWNEVRQYDFSERNAFQNGTYHHQYGTGYRHRAIGNELRLLPIPTTAESVRIHYVPRPETLSATTDTIEDFGGWSEFVVCRAAQLCLIDKGLDHPGLDKETERQRARLVKMGKRRSVEGNRLFTVPAGWRW